MSSYSKCRFCGNVDYADFPEPRMCKQCSIIYLAGEENAEQRIIKLLFKHSPAELGNEPITYEPVSMCGDLCHLRSDDEGWEWKDHFIALIKGEQK